ncbi:MAG: hypothetical protein ACI36V_04495 [Coriobacteriales bacterium]
MALGRGSGISTGAAILVFALAGLAGTAASLYAMVIAYLAGSSAQAAIDGTSPADPQALAMASMAELGETVAAQGQRAPVIEIDENSVVVEDHEPRGGGA